jgi:hypothetical protein
VVGGFARPLTVSAWRPCPPHHAVTTLFRAGKALIPALRGIMPSAHGSFQPFSGLVVHVPQRRSREERLIHPFEC